MKVCERKMVRLPWSMFTRTLLTNYKGCHYLCAMYIYATAAFYLKGLLSKLPFCATTLLGRAFGRSRFQIVETWTYFEFDLGFDLTKPRFEVFHHQGELNLMVMGVVSGMRVLIWAARSSRNRGNRGNLVGSFVKLPGIGEACLCSPHHWTLPLRIP